MIHQSDILSTRCHCSPPDYLRWRFDVISTWKRVVLPPEELPQGRVLDPVEADDGLRGQSALEERLNAAVILC